MDRETAWPHRPATPAARRALALALTALSAAGFAWQASRGTPWFAFDDAYITLHNALALRRGVDPNFPGVPALVGATSGAHVLLVALLTTLASPLHALLLAGWIGAWLYALALGRLAAAARLGWPTSILLTLFGLLVARTPHQLFNGLETGLAMAGVTFALAEHVGETRDDAPAPPRAWLPLACGALPSLRPELAALSALLLGLRALRRLRAQPRADALRGVARDALLALAAAAPTALAYLATTGAPLPSTVSAKRHFFAEGCLPPSLKRLWVRWNFVALAGLAGYAWRGALLLPLSSVGRVGVAFGAALALSYYVAFPGALGHYEQRYMYVLVPFLAGGLAAALSDRRRIARAAALVLLIVGADESLWNLPARWTEHAATERFTREELDGVARWMRANLPRGATVLVHDVGYVSWATTFRLVDIVGLKSPGSLAPHRVHTWPTCGAGRGEAVARIARESRADHLVVLQRWDEIYRFVESLRARRWTVTPLRTEGAYRVFRIAPP